MPWADLREFRIPYKDANDYAIGWASPILFYVFFTALEYLDGPDEGTRNLYRFRGHWNGKVISWDETDPITGMIPITKLGPVEAGQISKIARTEGGSFALWIGSGGS